MTSQTGQQMITIHILPSISRNKGNRTIKFGELIEYNNRNIFLENHTQDMAEKLVPDLCMKNQNLAHLCFYCMSKSRSIKLY